MISSYDYYKQIESPNMYLCNPDGRFLCALNGDNRHLILRFNDLSELSFTVPKISGTETYYNLIESKRLIYVEKIGWFQIEEVSEDTEGDNSSKDVTAKSHQYALKNRGFVTEERLYMFYNPNDPLDEQYDSYNTLAIPSVVGQLYQQLGIKVLLNNTDIEASEDFGDWTITYIDPILKFQSKSYSAMYEAAGDAENVCRGFEENTELNGYDFIMNKAESAFEVIFEFDFLYHTIKVKTLDDITKTTDIYLSFDNIINTLNVKENAEDIVTVMSCNGSDIDIRTVNPTGTNYIVDFDYYKKKKSDDGEIDYPWMSKELIETLDAWEVEFEKWQLDDDSRAEHTKSYSTLVKELQELYLEKTTSDADIQYANLKLTDMQVARDQYLDGDDDPLDGDGYVTAESVDVDAKSLLEASRFYSTPFTDSVSIVGHTTAPTPTKGNDGHYTFSFADAGTGGTPKSLILNFVDSTADDDNLAVPFYFMDGDTRSYCKLNVESEVGIVKDADGNIASSGTAEVRGVVFGITNTNGTFAITFPNGTFASASQSNSYFIYDGARYRVLASADGIISVYAFFVSGFERYTTYAETAGNNGWCSIWENYINNELVPINESLEEEIEEIEVEMAYINEQCNIQQFVKRCGQDLYDELSVYWIEGDYTNDNIATYDTTTMAERIDLAKELMAAGKVDLAKCAQPQFEMTVDAINFIKMYEFRQFTNQLVLGRIITIEKNDEVCYRPALMSIEYDLDVTDSFSMTFSNASKPGDTAMTFADLIKESSSTSRTVSANWSNLTDYSRNKETISNMIKAPLARTLRTAQSNMASQAFVVDETGILGRKYDKDFDESGGTFLPEQVRIINNTILFTDDNWESASLALGKIYGGDGEYLGYGLAADVLIGTLLMGESLHIKNSNSTILLDGTGITIKNNTTDEVLFSADTNGDVVLKGSVYANAGTIGVLTINADGSIQSSTGHFSVGKDGNLTAKGGGTIGGYKISDTALTSGNIGMSSDTTSGAYAFWAGNSTASSAPFSVTNTGIIVATSGNIGNLTLGDGSLYSQNFKLETIKQDSVTISWLKFYDQNGNETTSISNTDIATSNIAVTGSIAGGSMETDQLSLNDGLCIKDNRILGSLTSIQFDGTGESETYTATLSYSNWDNYLKITLTGALRYTKTFRIYYKVVWGSSYSTATVTISAGSSGGQTTVSAFWGISDAYLNPHTSGNQHSITFTQKTSTAQINVTGSLVPSAPDAYDLGTKNYPWNELRVNQAYLASDETVTSDAKYKNNIQSIGDIYTKLFDLLRPVTYNLSYGESGRTHLGLIAQEVKASMDELGIDGKEFAVYCSWLDTDETETCGLRYGELIPLCILEIQRLKKRIQDLEGN